MQDASVNLGDWLLTMAGEALANMIDQQGFIGGTATTAPGPFVGIMNVTGVNTYTLPSGGTSYNKFNPVTDAGNVIAQLEESILDGAAWYMHRTTWGGGPHRACFDLRLTVLVLRQSQRRPARKQSGRRTDQAGRRDGWLSGLHKPLAPRLHLRHDETPQPRS